MSQKRVVAFVFLSLVLFSLVAGFVSAQLGIPGIDPTPDSVLSKIFDPVNDLFTNWEKGNLSINLAKYLFWLLVTIFVYSIVGFIPALKKLHGGAKFLFSLIVGFLSTAYITPSDVYTMLAGYSALGFVLSAFLPLIILLFFSVEISKENNSGGRVISKFMWFAFIVFLVWKLIDGMFGVTTGGARVISLAQGWIYIAVILFSLLWLWFIEREFLKMLFKADAKVFNAGAYSGAIARTEARIARLVDEKDALDDSNDPNGQKRGVLELQIKSLQKSVAENTKKLADYGAS